MRQSWTSFRIFPCTFLRFARDSFTPSTKTCRDFKYVECGELQQLLRARRRRPAHATFWFPLRRAVMNPPLLEKAAIIIKTSPSCSGWLKQSECAAICKLQQQPPAPCPWSGGLSPAAPHPATISASVYARCSLRLLLKKKKKKTSSARSRCGLLLQQIGRTTWIWRYLITATRAVWENVHTHASV